MCFLLLAAELAERFLPLGDDLGLAALGLALRGGGLLGKGVAAGAKDRLLALAFGGFGVDQGPLLLVRAIDGLEDRQHHGDQVDEELVPAHRE